MEYIDVNIEEQVSQELVEVLIDENSAQVAIDAAALAQQTLEQVQDALASFNIVNTIFVNNSFTKVGQIFTGNAGTQWNINGFNYTNPTDQELTIPLCAVGKERTDRIVLDTNNNFVRVQGVEVESNPVAQSKPVNTLDYTFIPVNDSEVGDPELPSSGSLFIQKEFDKAQSFVGVSPGTDIVIPLNKEGRRVILLQGTIVNIKGLSKSLIDGDATAENPHEGKIFTFINDTAGPVSFNHNETDQDIWFLFKGLANLIIPSKERIDFMYRSSTLEEHHKTWEDFKTINGQSIKGTGNLVIGSPNKRTVCFTYEFNGALNTATNNWWGAISNGVPSQLTSNASLTPANNFSSAPVQSPAWVVPFNCRLKSITFKGFSNAGYGLVDLAFSSGTYLGSGSVLVNNTILSNQPFTIHNYLGVGNSSCSLYVFDTKFTNYVIPKGYEIRMFMNNRNVAKNLLSATITVEFEEEI